MIVFNIYFRISSLEYRVLNPLKTSQIPNTNSKRPVGAFNTKYSMVMTSTMLNSNSILASIDNITPNIPQADNHLGINLVFKNKMYNIRLAILMVNTIKMWLM